MSSGTVKGLLAVAFFGATAFSIPAEAPKFGFGIPDKMTPEQQQQMIGAVMEITRDNYYDAARAGDTEKLTDTMLSAAIKSLDPHSDYMNAKTLKEWREAFSGKFGGIGIEMGVRKGKQLVVMSTMDDGPAQRAGIKADDVLISINDMPVPAGDVGFIVKNTRGEPGTAVKVTVRRPGVNTPLSFGLIRGEVQSKDIKTAKIGDDIAYIRIAQFGNSQQMESFPEIVAALNAQFPGGHAKSYIIDLNNDPGGSLYGAVNMTADILGTGKTIVSTQGKKPGDNSQLHGHMGQEDKIVNLTGTAPIIVLVNEGSASASEVMTGALRDLAPDRVTVMGKQTFGKGLVQSIMPLAQFAATFQKYGIDYNNIPAGALKLTTAQYFSPKGISIQNVGITPHIEILANSSDAEKEPATPPRSEASLPSLARPSTSAAETVKTTQSCTPHRDIQVKNDFDKMLKDADGNVRPEILCAVEKLRGTQNWTNIAPYTPSPKPLAPSPSS